MQSFNGGCLPNASCVGPYRMLSTGGLNVVQHAQLVTPPTPVGAFRMLSAPGVTSTSSNLGPAPQRYISGESLVVSTTALTVGHPASSTPQVPHTQDQTVWRDAPATPRKQGSSLHRHDSPGRCSSPSPSDRPASRGSSPSPSSRADNSRCSTPGKGYVRSANVAVPAALEQVAFLDSQSSESKAEARQRNVERLVAARKRAHLASRLKAQRYGQGTCRDSLFSEQSTSCSTCPEDKSLKTPRSQFRVHFNAGHSSQGQAELLASSSRMSSQDIEDISNVSHVNSPAMSTQSLAGSGRLHAFSQHSHLIKPTSGTLNSPGMSSQSLTESGRFSALSIHSHNSPSIKPTSIPGSPPGSPRRITGRCHIIGSPPSSPPMTPLRDGRISGRCDSPHTQTWSPTTVRFAHNQNSSLPLDVKDASDKMDVPVRILTPKTMPDATQNSDANPAPDKDRIGVVTPNKETEARQRTDASPAPRQAQSGGHGRAKKHSKSLNQRGILRSSRSSSADSRRSRHLQRCHSLYEDAVQRWARHKDKKKELKDEERAMLDAMKIVVQKSLQGPAHDPRTYLERFADFEQRKEASRCERTEARIYEQKCQAKSEWKECTFQPKISKAAAGLAEFAGTPGTPGTPSHYQNLADRRLRQLDECDPLCEASKESARVLPPNCYGGLAERWLRQSDLEGGALQRRCSKGSTGSPLLSPRSHYRSPAERQEEYTPQRRLQGSAASSASAPSSHYPHVRQGSAASSASSPSSHYPHVRQVSAASSASSPSSHHPHVRQVSAASSASSPSSHYRHVRQVSAASSASSPSRHYPHVRQSETEERIPHHMVSQGSASPAASPPSSYRSVAECRLRQPESPPSHYRNLPERQVCQQSGHEVPASPAQSSKEAAKLSKLQQAMASQCKLMNQLGDNQLLLELQEFCDEIRPPLDYQTNGFFHAARENRK